RCLKERLALLSSHRKMRTSATQRLPTSGPLKRREALDALSPWHTPLFCSDFPVRDAFQVLQFCGYALLQLFPTDTEARHGESNRRSLGPHGIIRIQVNLWPSSRDGAYSELFRPGDEPRPLARMIHEACIYRI